MFQQLGQKKGTKLKLNKYKRISPEFDWITEFICSSSFDPVLIVYCVELTQYGIKHSKSSTSFRDHSKRPNLLPTVRGTLSRTV